MDEMRDVTLPSGAVLSVGLAPFADSLALYQSLLEEGKTLTLDPSQNVDANFYKDLFCVGFSSKKIEASTKKCMEKCLYNKLRIDSQTFEPVKAREDYMTVLFEVTKDNIAPFTKSLYAQLQLFITMMQNIQS